MCAAANTSNSFTIAFLSDGSRLIGAPWPAELSGPYPGAPPSISQSVGGSEASLPRNDLIPCLDRSAPWSFEGWAVRLALFIIQAKALSESATLCSSLADEAVVAMAQSRSPLPQIPFGCESLKRPLLVVSCPASRRFVGDVDADCRRRRADAFDSISNAPYPSPPALPPGPSLLDVRETHALANFFNEVDASSFDDSVFFLEHPLQSHLEPLRIVDDHVGTPMDLVIPSQVDSFLGSPTSQAGSPSEDVLAAASTLLRSRPLRLPAAPQQSAHGHTLGPSPYQQPYHPPPLTGSATHLSNNPLYAVSAAQLSNGSLIISSSAPTPSHFTAPLGVSEAFPNPFLFSPSQALAASSSAPTRVDHATRATGLSFGSDVGFLDHGYVAPPNQETEEQIAQGMIQKAGLIVAHAQPVGRDEKLQSSPVISDPGATFALESSTPSGYSPSPVDDQAPPQRKRRRTTLSNGAGNTKNEPGNSDDDDEGDDDSLEAESSIRAKKPKPNSARPTKKSAGTGTQNASSPPKGPARPRKPRKPPSAATAAETSKDGGGGGDNNNNGVDVAGAGGRENLTEEQRRSNHILSEQRRRNLIKEHFDKLCSLVPELRGGGYSKSATLAQAADFLEDLLVGNDELRAMLASLQEARQGGGDAAAAA